ncbi:hypothetical protein BH11ARM2_BH11ARM2_38180 [soil metagenome]
MGLLKHAWRHRDPQVVTGLLFFVYRCLAMTIRVKVIGYVESEQGTLYCGWHGRSFVFANEMRHRNLSVIVSQSRDGEIQSRIFKWLGYGLIRGSTGRGGVRVLVESVRFLKKGGKMAMTPDGPRGPSKVCSPGVILMAQKSGAMVIPVGVAANPRWNIKSWDCYMVPKPFARGIVIFGEGFFVPNDADEAALEEARLRLEREITRCDDEAKGILGISPDQE